MNYTHALVIISCCISIIGAAAYIRDTLEGKTKPNRVSWFMWAVAPLIGTGAALSAEADLWATARIFLAGFLPLLIFFASFVNKQSYWKLTMFDGVCGAFSLVAILLWLFIQSPQVAILCAAIGDAFASIPTIRKAWRSPHTETGVTYITSFISLALILPSIPVWNVANSAFQIFLLIQNAVLLFVVYRYRLFPQVIYTKSS